MIYPVTKVKLNNLSNLLSVDHMLQVIGTKKNPSIYASIYLTYFERFLYLEHFGAEPMIQILFIFIQQHINKNYNYYKKRALSSMQLLKKKNQT